MFFLKLNSNDTTGGYMSNGFVSKFVYKCIDSMVMAKDNGATKTVIKSLDSFYEVSDVWIQNTQFGEPEGKQIRKNETT